MDKNYAHLIPPKKQVFKQILWENTGNIIFPNSCIFFCKNANFAFELVYIYIYLLFIFGRSKMKNKYFKVFFLMCNNIMLNIHRRRKL